MKKKHSARAPIKVSTKDELVDEIRASIRQNGFRCSLNHIDVSAIDNFDRLFSNALTYNNAEIDLSKFNGDISQWDMAAAQSVVSMFEGSKFKGDLSKWNISNVRCFDQMFAGSHFNGDISNWDVRSAKTMMHMFERSAFNGDLSKWDMRHAVGLQSMFAQSNYTKDLHWTLGPNAITIMMFFSSKEINLDSILIENNDSSSLLNMGAISQIKKPPRIMEHSVDAYREHLDAIFSEEGSCFLKHLNWSIPNTYSHALAMLLYPSRCNEHPSLNHLQTQIQTIFQLTNSVYHTCTHWEKHHHVPNLENFPSLVYDN